MQSTETDQTTRPDITIIAARADAATLGPWQVHRDGILAGVADADSGYIAEPPLTWTDAEFIAHAREDVPALLVALAAERDRADRAEARIAQAVDWDDYRDAHAFGDMGTPYVNGARHAHAAISRILREAAA